MAPQAPLPTLRPSNNTSQPTKQLRRPNTVLVVPAYGGVGNQIYFLLEALVLARQAHLDVVIPSLPPREFGLTSVEATEETEAGNFWDLPSLQRALNPHGRVLSSLPNSCEGRFDAVYVTRRCDPPAAPPRATVSSRVKQAAIFLTSKYDWGETGRPKTEKECAKHVFHSAAVVRRYLPLSRPHDDYFINELKNMREQAVLPSGSMDLARPACVIVDGHSFNMAGKEGHEYLYSFMHFLEPAPRIVEMASHWKLDEMTVLHLRYDEKECVPTKRTKGKICIRARLAAGEPDTVYWSPIKQLVSAVLKSMISHDAHTLYIATSPYVPEDTVKALRAEFAAHVSVASRVQSSLGHNEQNFLERELAIRCKCFIGDFASTWSGTVYYKRRTLGLKTVWSSALLGENQGLGYYEAEEAIPRPEVFENTFDSATV